MIKQIEGQMSLFDIVEAQEINTKTTIDDIAKREILKGSGFAEGKTRIYNFFNENHTENEQIAFLKKEYGQGGWSIPEGFCNHDATGIDIELKEAIGKTTALHMGWMMVARRINKLVEDGEYQPGKDNFNTMTIQRAAELIEKETGIKFKSDNRHFKDCYSAKHNGYEIDIFFTHYAPGIRDERRFLDLSISKGNSSSGNPCESIKEAIRTINKRIFECQYSGHNCNKEELWKIAESLDDPFCPHVCCRNCATKGCGARCNGSEEPKDKVKCQKSEECEAYPTGCGGSIEPCRFGGPFKWSAKEVIVKGYMDDGYCPNCDGCLDELVEECPYCKQKVTWENWKRINKK